MRGIIAFVAAVSLCGGVAASERDGRQVVEELFAVTGFETVLDETMEQMLELQIQQNPAIAPFKSVMKQFIAKHMSLPSLAPDLTRIYLEAFTAQELEDIVAFYKTPTGKKSIKLMPALMRQGAELGLARVQAKRAELQRMIKEESERIQNLQKKSSQSDAPALILSESGWR